MILLTVRDLAHRRVRFVVIALSAVVFSLLFVMTGLVEQFNRELRSQGRLIVVSTHDARLVPIADRVIRMSPDADARDLDTHEVLLPAGELLFRQGDASDFVHLVESGEFDIVRELRGGGEEPITRIDPGHCCGELGPLMGFPRSATARAVGDVRLTAMSPRRFRERILHR